MKDWYTDIRGYFLAGLWDESMVNNAVAKGKITTAQANQLIKEKQEG